MVHFSLAVLRPYGDILFLSLLYWGKLSIRKDIYLIFEGVLDTLLFQILIGVWQREKIQIVRVRGKYVYPYGRFYGS